ncbi:MAG: tetratricopeptide repeat protein [Planctomycetaceae bacterium]
MSASQIDSDEKTRKKPDRPNRRLSVWKKFLFATIITVTFFATIELVLAALGVKPVTYREDPFVGFTSRSPLFEKAKTADGKFVYRTREQKLSLFNLQEFPVDKGKDTYRVFCMGGSTTYGHPYVDSTSFGGWLREYLNIADQRHAWEVINAGGISYASYRVASLMEELIEYEPDLFIIYSGQNEFLERRTYSQILATPGVVREVAAVFATSRVYSSMRTLFKNAVWTVPQDSLKANILPAEVDAILDGAVGPDDYTRDDTQQQQVIDHYSLNLARMIELARSAGATVIMINPAANERSMSPFKSQHRDLLNHDDLEQWKTLISQAKMTQKSGQFDEALKLFDLAIEIDPFYAESHFNRGEVLYALGRYPEAKQAFQRAIDEDVCPLRILSEMRRRVAEVATRYNVPLVDFQQLLEGKTTTGILGDEWFLDHVHTNTEGYRELALRLFAILTSQGVVVPDSRWTPENRQKLEAEVTGRIDERAQGVALRTLAKVFSWARKYEEAGRLSKLAAEKLSDDAEVHCMAAYDFERNGQFDQAKESYEKAIQLNPTYAHAHYNLGHVHRQLKEWSLATKSFENAVAADPHYPGAHYNLGLLYQKAGRLDDAAMCFRASISVNGTHPGSWEELGNVRLEQGRIDEAIQHLEMALKLQPDMASTNNSLGVAFARSGQVEKAAAYFERAVELVPQYVEAQQNLSRARALLK